MLELFIGMTLKGTSMDSATLAPKVLGVWIVD